MAGDGVHAGDVPRRRGVARVLRQRAHQLRGGAVPRVLPGAGALARAARDRAPARSNPERRALHRLRVQDPGEHGPEAPRPDRLRARLLRALRGGNAGEARAHREADAARRADAVPGPRAHHHRGGVAGRRDRHPRPRHPAHRRHALQRTASWSSAGSRASPRSTSRASGSATRCAASSWIPGCSSSPRRARRRCSTRSRSPGPSPIVGAVGMLQFDVLLHRLEHEYGVTAKLDFLNYRSRALGGGPAGRDRSAGVGGSAGRWCTTPRSGRWSSSRASGACGRPWRRRRRCSSTTSRRNR